jgi:glycine/D-amino acid oxidase-like deaminating enzyme
VRNGQGGFWQSDLGQQDRRPALAGDLDVDVAIVGGGYTGLWTAYYLRLADPTLRVAVLEAEHAGFGASGRNGGWLSGTATGDRERYASDGGREGAIRLERAAIATLYEVGVAQSAAARSAARGSATRAGVGRPRRRRPAAARAG